MAAHQTTAASGLGQDSSSTGGRTDLVSACGVVIALWLVYFRAMPHLGLYNDDYYNVGYPASLPFGQVWHQCAAWLMAWPNGRPLGAVVSWLAAYILVHVGGIHAIYLLPFIVVALNSYLIHKIVSGITTPLAGFIAAIAYAISPVDTVRLQYTGAAFYQTAIALTLAALILYGHGKHVAAYAILFCSLLFHECAILGFLAAPILTVSRRRLLPEMVKNAFIVIGIVISDLFVRSRWMNESRSQAMVADARNVLYRSLKSATVGPMTHLQLMGTRTIQSLTRPLRAEVAGTLLALIVLLGICFILILGVSNVASGRWKVKTILSALSGERQPAPELLAGYVRVFCAGLIIFDLNYLVFFLDPYYPASETAGMVALVHTAAGVGLAFCIAACGMLFIAGLRLLKLPFVGFAMIVLSLGGFGAWGSLIRAQYEESWRNQQLFWENITTIVPDAVNGTLIVVEAAKPLDLPFTWIMPSHSWADTVVPRMLYRTSWTDPPMLYVLPPSWRGNVQNRSGNLYWMRLPSVVPPGWEALPQGNMVVILANDGVLTRLQGSLDIPAGVIHLKPPPITRFPPILSDGIVRRYLLPSL